MADQNKAPGLVDLMKMVVSIPADWDDWAWNDQWRHANRLYLNECVPNGRTGEHSTHDDEKVLFFGDAFGHAFQTSADRRRAAYVKDTLDLERIERVRWIKPLISGQVEKFECYLITDRSKRPPTSQRLYAIRQPDYVYIVWLVPRRGGGWKFQTAYTTSHKYLQEQIFRQRRLWPPSHIIL